MNHITCLVEITKNGCLKLPQNITHHLHKFNQNRFKIIILENMKYEPIGRFCGEWSGDNADEMIKNIRKNRENNNRAESIEIL